MRRFFYYGVAGAAALALSVLGVTGASAHPHPGPQAPTAACNVTDPFCAEPVVAQAADPTQDFNPSADFALTYAGPNTNTGQVGGAVIIATNNNIQNGSQDWQFDNLGLVPSPGTDPPFPYGLNANDLLLYGASDQETLGSLQYTPFGQSTPFCLSVNKYNKTVLQLCSGKRNQVFIISDDPIGLQETPPGYNYVLSVLHSATTQQHNCLTAPTAQFDLSGPLTLQRCAFVSPGVATDQMWSAIP